MEILDGVWNLKILIHQNKILMKLTGKAKVNFLDYYWENYIGKTRCVSKKEETEDFFKSLIAPLKTTLLIEWLDSVNLSVIPMKIFGSTYPWQYKINENIYCGIPNRFETRQEALTKGISRAIEIYNM